MGLEAIRGVKTVNEIGQDHGVHPAQVGQWKKEILEQAGTLFEKKRGPKQVDGAGEPDRLYGEIGRLKMELDWLKKTHHLYSEYSSFFLHSKKIFFQRKLVKKYFSKWITCLCEKARILIQIGARFRILIQIHCIWIHQTGFEINIRSRPEQKKVGLR